MRDCIRIWAGRDGNFLWRDRSQRMHFCERIIDREEYWLESEFPMATWHRVIPCSRGVWGVHDRKLTFWDRHVGVRDIWEFGDDYDFFGVVDCLGGRIDVAMLRKNADDGFSDIYRVESDGDTSILYPALSFARTEPGWIFLRESFASLVDDDLPHHEQRGDRPTLVARNTVRVPPYLIEVSVSRTGVWIATQDRCELWSHDFSRIILDFRPGAGRIIVEAVFSDDRAIVHTCGQSENRISRVSQAGNWTDIYKGPEACAVLSNLEVVTASGNIYDHCGTRRVMSMLPAPGI